MGGEFNISDTRMKWQGILIHGYFSGKNKKLILIFNYENQVIYTDGERSRTFLAVTYSQPVQVKSDQTDHIA